MIRDTKKTLAEVDILGIEDAKLQYKDKKIASIKVKATIELSESGLVSVPKAYVILEVAKPNQGIIDGVMDFFSSSEKEKVFLYLFSNYRLQKMRRINQIKRSKLPKRRRKK